MANRLSWAIAVLLLRLLTFASLLASVIILGTDTANFKNYHKVDMFQYYAYRYVLSVGVIVGVYMLVQIILSAISFVVRSYFVNKSHIWWNLFSDVVFALFCATGAGAGYGLTVDYKEEYDAKYGERSYILDRYFKTVYSSSALLLMASVIMGGIVLSTVRYVLARAELVQPSAEKYPM